MTIETSTPLSQLPGMDRGVLASLDKLGLRTAQDLAFFFPRDYEFPAPPGKVAELVDSQPASLIGVVEESETRTRGGGRSIFSALIRCDDDEAFRIVFFNQGFRQKMLWRGRRIMVSGKPKLSGFRWEFSHPKLVMLADDDEMPTPEPLPIYPLVEGLRQVDVRRLTAKVVPAIAPEIAEVMSSDLRRDVGERLRAEEVDLVGDLPSIADAMRQIHFPDDEAASRAAVMRFVFQELFVMQLALALRRRRLTTDLRSTPVEIPPSIDAKIRGRFAFELTSDQSRAIDDIRADLRRQFPMNRLLQGDVGSGKTAVALYAMLATAAAGFQSTIMVPTEVLARQHFANFRGVAGDTARIGLVCGSMSTAERRQTLRDVAAGEIDILVGTQSLIHGEITFANLALCIIDEQHKFGVNQRVTLRGGGVDPHYLVMSATPIPRSVAMTVFGDVDLSTIRERPPGRGDVNTYLVADDLRDRWWQFVRRSVAEGRQVYVVAPRVSARETADRNLSDGMFPIAMFPIEMFPIGTTRASTVCKAKPTRPS